MLKTNDWTHDAQGGSRLTGHAGKSLLRTQWKHSNSHHLAGSCLQVLIDKAMNIKHQIRQSGFQGQRVESHTLQNIEPGRLWASCFRFPTGVINIDRTEQEDMCVYKYGTQLPGVTFWWPNHFVEAS